MSELPADLEPMDEDKVRKIADIIGGQSAAQAALDNLAQKRADGVNAVIGYSRQHSCFVVCDIGRL